MTPHGSLDARGRRLELANRTLVAALALFGALGLTAFLRPAAQASDLLRVRRIQLVDDAGAVRID